jgi:deoxyribodipyrimidine photo-lyase
MAQRIIYWFRNDLRLNDNEALFNAALSAQEIVPVYVFDPRQFDKTRFGFRRTGALRAQFILDSVSELRNLIREKGGDLMIRIGEPEKIIPQLAEHYNADYVYASKEIGPEETQIESSLSKNLKLSNVDIKLFWMDTLVQAIDLPFPISKLPTNFPDFYNKIKACLNIREPFSAPEKITLPAEFEAGTLPSLPSLGVDPEELSAPDLKTGVTTGGETLALRALETFLKTAGSKSDDTETLDTITDSGLSQWLSPGCLSARSIYHGIKSHGQINNPERIIHDLLKRDYFHWVLLRFGPRIFKPSGIKHDFSTRWNNDYDTLNKWIKGQTDNEKVNAVMSELRATGFLPTRERQLAADYLVNHLGINWTMGATYFESCLLDYEVSVSWGRWNNIASVGEH